MFLSWFIIITGISVKCGSGVHHVLKRLVSNQISEGHLLNHPGAMASLLF